MEGGSLECFCLNFYLNHSKIREFTRPDDIEYLDASELLNRDGSRLFRYPDGVIFFFPSEGEMYMEAHFLKTKGKEAKERILKALEQIKGTVIAEAPEFNKASRQMINSLGFKKTGISGQWVRDGVTYNVIRYQLER